MVPFAAGIRQDTGWPALPHENPWFLITAREIESIQTSLQGISGIIPEQHRAPVSDAIRILITVQERQP